MCVDKCISPTLVLVRSLNYICRPNVESYYSYISCIACIVLGTHYLQRRRESFRLRTARPSRDESGSKEQLLAEKIRTNHNSEGMGRQRHMIIGQNQNKKK